MEYYLSGGDLLDLEDDDLEPVQDGSWSTPSDWPVCLATVNCSAPPARPSSGTWEWDGGLGFRSGYSPYS